ncbi:sensor histidine kinase [Orbaceae bacterium ESL0721]|nr:sensor histidine kinase [Orbaceae bacterium ESL0721]
MFIKKPLSFTNKLFASLLLFSLVCLLLLQSYLWNVTEDSLYRNLGGKAQIQAKELAVIPDLISYVEARDSQKIAELISNIFAQSDASYIVIGDENAHRLFHTTTGITHTAMVGGDNQEVLKGHSIVTVRKGSLGSSLRGKAPIINREGKIIGIVSVGYMIDNIYELHREQFIPFIIFCSLFFVSLFIFSLIFARTVKKQMFNLEPKEIAMLVKSQQSIMESIFEGIIAIDLDYKIININQSARQMLNIETTADKLIHQNLFDFVKSNNFINGARNRQEDLNDYICYFNDSVVIASRIRIIIDNQIQGWVITFRNFDDINLLSMQLTQVKQYADNLRTLRHEHLNWMATLSGLIYLKRYDEAEAFIVMHSVNNQENLDFINQHFKIPAICGLLIGKYAKSHELGLALVFDPACQLVALPPALSETEFASILGNLLDNAFNACLKDPQSGKQVYLYLSDATDEIVIEVSDQGCGVDKALRDTIFEQGVTSQSPKEHGIGLHLVATYIKKANGFITFSDNDPSGTIFSVFIPK